MRLDIGPSARAWCIIYWHQSSCMKSGVISRAHRWLSCTAWQSSVEVAPPGQSSLCCRKHRRQRGEASRKETSRPASSQSLSAELWHTNTSYLRRHRCSELRGRWECKEGAVPADDDEEKQADEEEGGVETLIIEDTGFFIAFPSCSKCADKEALGFKIFWNQPETIDTNYLFLT